MSWTTYPHNYTFSVLYMSNTCEYVAKNSITLCVILKTINVHKWITFPSIEYLLVSVSKQLGK